MDKKALELLFQSPLEPSFTPRNNGKSILDLPESFYTDRYKNIPAELEDRFGNDFDERIPLRDIVKPNLSFVTIGLKENFSVFNQNHKEQAGQLIKLFMDAPDRSTLASLAAYCKDRINPLLFHYCYSVAIEHRKDTQDVNVPSVVESFPSSFVEPSVFSDAREEGTLIRPGNRVTIDIPLNYTASPREPEQRLAYFREDIGVNLHHWHWHLVYPSTGPDSVVNKDRRGELFFYMHQQIIARYNVERFCNSLPTVDPLVNLRKSIPEGYFPKILSSTSNRTFAGRLRNANLQDLNRPVSTVSLGDMERWRDRIMLAIDQGVVMSSQGQQIPLDEIKGIDVLGNILERSNLTVNSQLYGDYHGAGHDIIGFSHDPDNRYLEDMGVMADLATTMRDPAFYRWHSHIDNIFRKHKELLSSYTPQQLSFDNVQVNGIDVKISSSKAKPNTLLTYWQKSDVDLAAGLDFGPNGNVYAKFTHLQHAPFEYTINVTNGGGGRRGTARIYLIPRSDERGAPLSLNDARWLALEMDKFTVTLQPGPNTIKRRSDQSSLTIPFERTFRRVGTADQGPAGAGQDQFRFCGCGWPQHMLLPKGTADGMQFDLYVMISDYNGDEVRQPNSAPDVCGDAASFCGLKDKLWPDKRSMGYPFDRRLDGRNFQEFVGRYGNMAMQGIVIKFNDTVVDRV